VLPPADAARLAHTETLVVRNVVGTALDATAIGEPEPGDTLTADGELVKFSLSDAAATAVEDVIQVVVEYPLSVDFTIGAAGQSVTPSVVLRTPGPGGVGTAETTLRPADHGVYVSFGLSGGGGDHLSVDPSTGELRPTDPARMVPSGVYAVRAELVSEIAGGAHVSNTQVRSHAAFRYVNAGAPVAATQSVAIKERAPLYPSSDYVPSGFSVKSGALPPGLDVDPTTGVLSGTPAAPGEYSVVVTANATDKGSGTVVSEGYRSDEVAFVVQGIGVDVVDASDPDPSAPDPTDKNAGGSRGARVNAVGYVGVAAVCCGAAVSVASSFMSPASN
jgi:hypothetical protein